MLTACGAFLFGAALLTGCSEKPAETLPGHQVKGKVTFSGKEPGTFASLVFVSANDANETGSAGMDPSGVFSGRVPLGKCKVAVKVGGAPTGPGGGGGFPKGGGGPGGGGFPKGGGPTGPPGGAGGGSNGPMAPKGLTIPQKFTDPKTSGVEVNIVDGEDVNIDFPITPPKSEGKEPTK
jgi:hypothetical protein